MMVGRIEKHTDGILQVLGSGTPRRHRLHFYNCGGFNLQVLKNNFHQLIHRGCENYIITKATRTVASPAISAIAIGTQ